MSIPEVNTSHIYSGIKVVFLLLLFGCSQYTNKEQQHSPIFEKIYKIETDSLRKIEMSYRDAHIMVMRYYINDTCGYIQLFSRRMDDDILKVKYKDKWVNIDSIEYYYPLDTFGISKDKIIYSFKIMDELYLDNVSTSCDYKGLRIKKDSFVFYHLFDTTLIEQYDTDTTLKKLEGNWWVEK